jgi:hypothetical protein
MPNRFPPLARPTRSETRIRALPAPSLPWFEMGVALALMMLALAQ